MLRSNKTTGNGDGVVLIKVIGCDASGKSTFIEALSKELGYPVKKGSSFELAKKSQDELFEFFKANQELENTILDRDFYCNLCYAPLYKDYNATAIL